MVKQEQLKNIFTVKTTGSHKQISIFGIKISIKIPQDKNIEIVTQNYQKVLNRIKNKPNSKKIKVLFLINDLSKWKTKSLYNLMKNSLDFEPIIALTLGDNQWELNSTEKNTLINNNKQYFNSQGIDCIIAYNLEQEEVISLKTFNLG